MIIKYCVVDKKHSDPADWYDLDEAHNYGQYNTVVEARERFDALVEYGYPAKEIGIFEIKVNSIPYISSAKPPANVKWCDTHKVPNCSYCKRLQSAK